MGVACKVSECGFEAKTAGYCHSHYMRLWRGDADPLRPVPRKVMQVVDGKKPCRDCGKNKSLEEFHRTSPNKGLGGRMSYCRECAPARKARCTRTQCEIENKQANYHLRRSAKLSILAESISIQGLIERDGTLCGYCKIELDFELMQSYNPRKASIEHVIPLYRGGTHTWNNVILACLRCNLSKNSKLAHEWMK